MSKTPYIPVERLKSLTELGGGIPRGTITAALGAPGACKSTLFTQILTEIAKSEKGNALILDTENSYHVYLELVGGLSAAYKVNLNLVRVRCNVKKTGPKTDTKYAIEWEMEDEPEDDAINIFCIHCPDIVPISIMHGRGLELTIFESGKFKVTMTPGAWVPDIADAPIVQFYRKHNCTAYLVDSFTNPLDEIPAVGENFPARADLTQIWMIQLQKMASELECPVFATFHESKNETNPFSKQLKIEGGKGVLYNLKHIIYMLLQNEMGLLPKSAAKPKTLASDERAMYLSRWPGRKPWSVVKYLTVTPGGLKDADGEDSAEEEEADEQPVVKVAPKKPVIAR